MTSPIRRLAAALVCLAVLTACGLPTSGTVETGLPVLGQAQQGVQVLPDGPEEGADPGQIVTGFLRANVGFPDDHDVARDFLTEELARQWRPTERVVVYDGDIEVLQEGPDTVVVRAEVRGTVDEMGYLTEADVDTARTERFAMTRGDGEWRISDFPDGFGLWLSRADFERLYRTRSVHYLAQHRPQFVTDARWFPQFTQSSGLATALARAQLAPTPSYLRGAVRDAFPDDVDLAAAGVPVDPSTATATVDLDGVTSTGSDEQVRQMWAQITQTLLQAPGVGRVTLRSGGRVMATTDIRDTLSDPSELGFTSPTVGVPFALLRVRNELTAVDPAHFSLRPYQPPDGESAPELPSIPVRWVDLAASPSVQDLAAVSFDRTELSRWHDGEQEVMAGIGSELTAPSYDRNGGLWVAGTTASGSRVWVVDTTVPMSRALARPVETAWLDERLEVLEFQVSPDDTRAVVHLRDRVTGRERLALTGIVRDRNGVPSALTPPQDVAPTILTAVSVQWISAERMVVLGQRQEDTNIIPLVVPLGGWVDAMPGVDQAVAVRAAADAEGEDTLLVLTEQGRIYTPEGTTWQTYRNGDDLVVPGF
jgi:Lipoprotein LpqB beta-propeller domain/Sporulation and spore germination